MNLFESVLYSFTFFYLVSIEFDLLRLKKKKESDLLIYLATLVMLLALGADDPSASGARGVACEIDLLAKQLVLLRRVAAAEHDGLLVGVGEEGCDVCHDVLAALKAGCKRCLLLSLLLLLLLLG